MLFPHRPPDVIVDAVMTHNPWRGVVAARVEPGLTCPVCAVSLHAPQMVHALSPKTSKAPTLDISQPVAISVPAKVGHCFNGRRVLGSHGNHS